MEIQEKQSDLQVVLALLDVHFESIGVFASECFIACQLSKGNSPRGEAICTSSALTKAPFLRAPFRFVLKALNLHWLSALLHAALWHLEQNSALDATCELT